MRDRNGYASKILVGKIEQSDHSQVIKCTVSFPHEIQRYMTLKAHPSLTMDTETRASTSLMVRRALILLQQHQTTLSTPLDISDEVQIYKWIAKTGNESKKG